jgi:ATP-dependent Clp protease protease subunit
MAKIEHPLRPEITVVSFNDAEVIAYINHLKLIVDQYGPNQPIVLNISSFGGSIYGLSHLYEYLQSLSNPIVTYTSSKAMSAGAILLSAAGYKGMRYASPNASIMIHEVQGGFWPDDIKNLEDNMDSLKQDNERWMTILAKSMGLKTAKDIRDLIKAKSVGHDLTLSSKQAKEIGLIDKVCYIKLESVFGYNIHTTDDLTVQHKPKKKSLNKENKNV